jgi:hypothetical protein
MIEKPKRPKKLNNQDRKIPINIQELINRYDLENNDIYDYLDSLVTSGILDFIYPVGTIYLSINNINPSTFLGGTWELWGQGKTIVGVDSGDTDFNLSEKTGGEKEHTLTINEMPSHSHGISANAHISSQAYSSGEARWPWTDQQEANRATMNAGGGQAHNNLQPYITCYMWKRVI